jgi:hypothetical protein
MAASPWRQALGDDRLLVSGFGKWGGGMYDLTSGRPRAFDDLPTSGVALGGGRLWRVLRAPGEQTHACELLSYDERGLRTYQRLDAIRDPHDACWHDGAVHVSSSWDGVVWRVGADGSTDAVWRGGTVPDSWHVNSLEVIDGRLHVCAFGRFDGYKAWKDDDHKATGFVHDIGRGGDVLTGLAHPHVPRRVGDRWYLCESTRGSVTELDADGRVLRRVRVRRFSRGLAVVGDRIFVGGNAHRKDPDDRAEIVVVDRDSFAVVDRIAMPCLEIYDIVAVPFDLARGVAIGFGGNPVRAVEQHRGTLREAPLHPTPDSARVALVPPRVAEKLAAAGQPLDRRTARKLAVHGELPTLMTAGEVRTTLVTVVNGSAVALATVAPRTIRAGARWFPADAVGSGAGGDGDGGDGKAEVHERAMKLVTPLPHLVHPGEQAETEIVLAAPDAPGRYVLRVALHQSGTGWFGARLQSEVVVEPAFPTVASAVECTGAAAPRTETAATNETAAAEGAPA